MTGSMLEAEPDISVLEAEPEISVQDDLTVTVEHVASDSAPPQQRAESWTESDRSSSYEAVDFRGSRPNGQIGIPDSLQNGTSYGNGYAFQNGHSYSDNWFQPNSVLEALNNAEFSRFHVKAIIITGMGFFTDAYDLFSIGLVSKLIGNIYYGYSTGEMPLNISAALSAVALCGTLAGQLLFGFGGDKYGRQVVYKITLWIMLVSSIGSALSPGRTAGTVITTLCIFRFLLGLGIGGDYPISATIISEYSPRRLRGMFISTVFAMQGAGILVAATVTLGTTAIFKSLTQNPQNADYVWRIVLGFAAIPTALTVYLRSSVPETARFSLFVSGNADLARNDMQLVLNTELKQDAFKRDEMTTSTFLRVFGVKLFGCSAAWFLLDVAFYSQNLFQSDVLRAIGWLPIRHIFWPSASGAYYETSPKFVCAGSEFSLPVTPPIVGTANCSEALYWPATNTDNPQAWMSPLDQTWLVARSQAIIALTCTVPGYLFTIITVETMGRWWIQTMGFFMMTFFVAILAAAYRPLLEVQWLFVAIYSLTFFFSNWGPNSTTFVFPAEIFPTKFRCTAHGISAAAGKAGAIVGAFGFLYAIGTHPLDEEDHSGIGLQNSLGVLSAIIFLGLLTTFCVPETKGRTLEDLGGEDIRLQL